MAAGDESGVVVGDDGAGVVGEPVEGVVGIGLAAAQIEDVADAALWQAAGCFGHAFEDEGVEPVVGVRVGAGEAFVEEHRQVAARWRVGSA